MGCLGLCIGLLGLSSVALAVEGSLVTEPIVGNESIVLEIDKTNLQARLKTLPDDLSKSQVLETFRIAIGKVQGDKEREGDNRTPEGIYFSQSILDGANLPAKYGPKAIPLNFPNPIDRLGGKTGHGIWLHGVEKDSRIEEARVTEGCVAFYNSDIERLTRWLRPHQGLVSIAVDATQLNRAHDLREIGRVAADWMDAWQSRDLDRYIDHYSEEFRHRRMNRAQYRAYKDRVFRSYERMTVSFDHIRTMSHPKYGLTVANQDFAGDGRFSAKGRKLLYWRKDPTQGRWQIIREIYENRRFESIPFEISPKLANSQAGSASQSDETATNL